MYFTQILPRWCPPSSQYKNVNGDVRKAAETEEISWKQSVESAPLSKYAHEKRGGVVVERANAQDLVIIDYSDGDGTCDKNQSHKPLSVANDPCVSAHYEEERPELKIVQGVHHPKFFLLFERRGSLVVIISTSNLSSKMNSLDGSWVQRFEPTDQSQHCNINISSSHATENVDMGMPSDFGVILVDFLKRQSEAASEGMLPDRFLKRYVKGLSLGLNSLTNCYRFEDAQVHLVSTVPGDYSECIPRKSVNVGFNPPRIEPMVSYGPQRVSFILSRLLNEDHIRSARASTASAMSGFSGRGMETVMPWLPPSLVKKMGRLVIQPTSLGGNWTRKDMEVMVNSYFRPHQQSEFNVDNHSIVADGGLLGLVDIVWPSRDYFEAMIDNRFSLLRKYPKEAAELAKSAFSTENNDGNFHLFLSSISFSKLDRYCISRMALFETSHPPQMPYGSTSLHIKSICRLFRLTEEQPPSENASPSSSSQQKEQESKDTIQYLPWFMLTSASLSRGAQGQPTPFRGFESNSMSYSNFELGILFCSRLLGDRLNDRLYVYNPNMYGCQCGSGHRWYKDRLRGESLSKLSFLESVRKVHLPIPYNLRPKPYQEDPDSDLMSYTPFMHVVPRGTGDVGNMKLTPLGQQLARENSIISDD